MIAVGAALSETDVVRGSQADVFVFFGAIAFIYWLVSTQSGNAVRSRLRMVTRRRSEHRK